MLPVGEGYSQRGDFMLLGPKNAWKTQMHGCLIVLVEHGHRHSTVGLLGTALLTSSSSWWTSDVDVHHIIILISVISILTT
jgi:hypothetical protein